MHQGGGAPSGLESSRPRTAPPQPQDGAVRAPARALTAVLGVPLPPEPSFSNGVVTTRSVQTRLRRLRVAGLRPPRAASIQLRGAPKWTGSDSHHRPPARLQAEPSSRRRGSLIAGVLRNARSIARPNSWSLLPGGEAGRPSFWFARCRRYSRSCSCQVRRAEVTTRPAPKVCRAHAKKLSADGRNAGSRDARDGISPPREFPDRPRAPTPTR
jgi:hypothetical protein